MKKQMFFKLVSAILALSILVSCTPKSTVKRGSDSAGWYEIAAGVIPENNPDPVDITRKDAHIPTPISYTNKTSSKEIKYEANTLVIGGGAKAEWGEHIAVIRSYDELKAVFEEDNEGLNEREYYIDLYTPEYFEDNALIMLFINGAGASSDKCTVERITKKRGQLQIYIKKIDRSNLLVSLNFRVFISVAKENLDGITNAVVYKEHIYS